MQNLIRRLNRENPLWSAEWIGDTLRLLGYDPPCDDTIRKYMAKPTNPRQKSTTWLPFLRNHLDVSWGIDFFTVVTVNFAFLYVFVVFHHGRMKGAPSRHYVQPLDGLGDPAASGGHAVRPATQVSLPGQRRDRRVVDPARKCGQVGYNAVARGHQGMGIGSAMMKFVMDCFQADGMEYATVLVSDNAEHAGWQPQLGPIKEEGVLPKLLRRYPTLYGELSDSYGALSRDSEYGPKVVTEFQDRLLFGTDICHFEQKFPLRDLLLEWRAAEKISESVFQKIARDNAVKLLGLVSASR